MSPRNRRTFTVRSVNLYFVAFAAAFGSLVGLSNLVGIGSAVGVGLAVAAGSLVAVASVADGLSDLVGKRARTTTARFALPRAARSAARLLPADVRDEFQEEWVAWLFDLRADGTTRTQRWVQLLTIVLVAVPQLAITLRRAAHRAAHR